MAQPNILTMEDVLSYIGVDTLDPDITLITSLKKMVENEARRFCRHNIAQPEDPYIEFHPKQDRFISGGRELTELQNGKVTTYRADESCMILPLEQMYVRSITSIREDLNAHFGQQAGDFPSSSALVEGTDFALEVDEVDADGAKLCKTGHVRRINGYWSSAAGTIKVTYVAGFTAAELADAYSDIKLALLDDLAQVYRRTKSRQAGPDALGGGDIQSYSIGGQISVSYGKMSAATLSAGLSRHAKAILQRYKRVVP